MWKLSSEHEPSQETHLNYVLSFARFSCASDCFWDNKKITMCNVRKLGCDYEPYQETHLNNASNFDMISVHF